MKAAAVVVAVAVVVAAVVDLDASILYTIDFQHVAKVLRCSAYIQR